MRGASQSVERLIDTAERVSRHAEAGQALCARSTKYCAATPCPAPMCPESCEVMALKIKFAAPRNAPPATNERQIAYMQKAEARERARRADRLTRLRAAAAGVKRATDSFERLDQAESSFVRLREGFIRLEEARRPGGRPADPEIADGMGREETLRRDVETRPPLTRLIFRRSLSLPLLLSVICVAHLESNPGQRFINRHGVSMRVAGESQFTWAQLSGMDRGRSETARARRARITRALDELANAGIVILDSGRTKYEKFRLAREDDPTRPYIVPGESAKNVVPIPIHFFLRGWHLVLTPQEIAVYLMITHLTHSLSQRKAIPPGEQEGVAAIQSVRDQLYGLSGEAYETIHELEEFRLIEIHDPMPERRRGKIRPRRSVPGRAVRTEGGAAPVPYRFVLRDLDPNAMAADVVMKTLADNPVPPLPPRLLAEVTFFEVGAPPVQHPSLAHNASRAPLLRATAAPSSTKE